MRQDGLSFLFRNGAVYRPIFLLFIYFYCHFYFLFCSDCSGIHFVAPKDFELVNFLPWFSWDLDYNLVPTGLAWDLFSLLKIFIFVSYPEKRFQLLIMPMGEGVFYDLRHCRSGGWAYLSVLGCLPSMPDALGSFSSTRRKWEQLIFIFYSIIEPMKKIVYVQSELKFLPSPSFF